MPTKRKPAGAPDAGAMHAVLVMALERARRFRSLPGVLGVSIGQRRRGGRWHAHELCVVVTVERKIPLGELRRRHQPRIPSSLRFTSGGVRYTIPVDVQHTFGERVGRLQGIVADKVDDQGDHIGAVGAVVQVGGRPRILVAGHVAVAEGRALGCGGIRGKVVEVQRSATLDHALVEPDAALPARSPRLVSGDALAGVRVVDAALVGVAVFCHDAASGARHATVVRTILDSAPFADASGTVVMEGLVTADACTIAGDSGTLLYDERFLAVGTLVGVLGARSYFLPCDDAFGRLGLTLLT